MAIPTLHRNTCACFTLACCAAVCALLACTHAEEEGNAAEQDTRVTSSAPVQNTARAVNPKDWLSDPVNYLRGQRLSMEEFIDPATLERAAMPAPIAAGASEVDERFVAEMHAIATLYRQYGPAETKPGWGDLVSRLPRLQREDAVASLSDKDNPSHGYRIYFTHARNRDAYRELGIEKDNQGQPRSPRLVLGNSDRQAIVKQTFAPRSISAELARASYRDDASVPSDEMRKRYHEARGETLDDSGWPHYPASVEFRDAHYIPGEPTGLFIMFRPEHDLDATDAGWIYGTTNAAGEITACGVMPRCVSCHEKCAPGRLFGPR